MADNFDAMINTEVIRFKAMCANIGRQPVTTFWMDFTIAERFGESALRDTYSKAVKERGSDVEYMGELTLVLNWKIWDLYEKNEPLANLYNELWTELQDYCWEEFEGEDAERYFEITD